MNAHNPPQRIVPHNIEAETALLGAILVDNAAYDRVSAFLDAEHFHDQLHRRIYEVASQMIAANKGANPITMKGFLPEKVDGLKIDGQDAPVFAYLVRLATQAVGLGIARDLGYAIHEAWIRRQAISACEGIVSLAYDLPPDKDVLSELAPIEDRLAALRAERVRGESRKGAGQVYLDSLSAAYQRGEVRGVPICLQEIANVLSEPCFEAGNLYGLLSSSGEGKTSLTLQIIGHALKQGHPVLFLSYDQSAEQCVRQMVAQEHSIEFRRQRDAKQLSEKEFAVCMDFANWIESRPFEVIKCTDQGAPQLAGFARTFIKRHANGRAPFIVVDHIRAIKSDNDRLDEGTKALRIGQILKSAAEMTGAAWLVLNQRNTFGMRRDNPRPIAADLFGGEGAKAPFDAIFYLYRYLKFLEERQATASSEMDYKKIARVFPSAVREDNEDIAQVGVIKSRFGNPALKENLIFEARFTRYKSENPPPEPGFL